MTGPELKGLLFTRKGELSEFARHCGISRQQLGERFMAAKMNMDTLKKYAAWKGIDEGQFILFATGPVPPPKGEYSTEDAPGAVVNEHSADYIPLSLTPQNETTMMNVIMKLLEDQKDKNQAINKLSDASLISSYTMAKLSGCTEREIKALLENRGPQGKAKVG